ncbi:MAG: hypothetical protein ACYC59_04740 [Anaerolineaceae bacterium]
MNKSLIFGSTIAALALGIFGTRTVFAASSEIAYRGPNGGSPVTQPGEESGLGLKDAYLVTYIADQLDVSSDEIQAQLDSGLTLSQILIEYGVTDYLSVIAAAHAYAIEQLAADGITIPGWQNLTNRMGIGGGDMVNRYGRSSR